MGMGQLRACLHKGMKGVLCAHSLHLLPMLFVCVSFAVLLNTSCGCKFLSAEDP